MDIKDVACALRTGGPSVEATLQERGSRYGPFSGHAAATQDLKGIIRDNLIENSAYQLLPGRDKAVVDEALEMIAHKIGRIVNGDPVYDDNWRDIAGYAQLVNKYFAGEESK